MKKNIFNFFDQFSFVRFFGQQDTDKVRFGFWESFDFFSFEFDFLKFTQSGKPLAYHSAVSNAKTYLLNQSFCSDHFKVLKNLRNTNLMP